MFAVQTSQISIHVLPAPTVAPGIYSLHSWKGRYHFVGFHRRHITCPVLLTGNQTVITRLPRSSAHSITRTRQLSFLLTFCIDYLTTKISLSRSCRYTLLYGPLLMRAKNISPFLRHSEQQRLGRITAKIFLPVSAVDSIITSPPQLSQIRTVSICISWISSVS